MKHNHIILDGTYTFKAEDNFGDYHNGKKRNGTPNKFGYVRHKYLCTDGKTHSVCEHVAKWEFFNGKIPDDMEIDHILPISKGGTNALSNLRIVDHIGNMNNQESTKTKSEMYSGEGNPMYGKHHSSATKALLSNLKLGTRRENFSKTVCQFNSEGELIAEYPRTIDAAIANNCCKSTIVLACNGNFGKQGHKALDSFFYYKSEGLAE